MPSTCADNSERIWCFANDEKNWAEHESTAVGLCGHLVSIVDVSKNDIIEELDQISMHNNQKFWIGLHCNSANGCILANPANWTWTDDLKYDYTTWDPDDEEPNDTHDPEERCVEIKKNGLWNDQNCMDTIPAVYDLPRSSLCGVDSNTTTCYSASDCTDGTGNCPALSCS
jgi:hypothetical protein